MKKWRDAAGRPEWKLCGGMREGWGRKARGRKTMAGRRSIRDMTVGLTGGRLGAIPLLIVRNWGAGGDTQGVGYHRGKRTGNHRRSVGLMGRR